VRPEYTVHLERVFQGPMDLLLHLVREQEVEIHEIEIARILAGYLGYLESLEHLDLEYAADFLVMAATLMAIKSRSLLSSEEIDLEQELDPRDELIQRLIEFRRFKRVADVLEEARRLRERQHERGSQHELGAGCREREFDLGELTCFDLLASYSRLMRETLADRPHQVALDPRPLRYYVEQVVQRLKQRPSLTLRSLVTTFGDAAEKETLIGSFCALLELVRLEAIEVEQSGRHGDIAIRVRGDRRAELDELVRGSLLADEQPREEETEPAAAGTGVGLETEAAQTLSEPWEEGPELEDGGDPSQS